MPSEGEGKLLTCDTMPIEMKTRTGEQGGSEKYETRLRMKKINE